jgi:hypothetical protein
MAHVRIDRIDRVAHLVLDRPERRNAIDEELVEDLITAIAELEAAEAELRASLKVKPVFDKELDRRAAALDSPEPEPEPA